MDFCKFNYFGVFQIISIKPSVPKLIMADGSLIVNEYRYLGASSIKPIELWRNKQGSIDIEDPNEFKLYLMDNGGLYVTNYDHQIYQDQVHISGFIWYVLPSYGQSADSPITTTTITSFESTQMTEIAKVSDSNNSADDSWWIWLIIIVIILIILCVCYVFGKRYRKKWITSVAEDRNEDTDSEDYVEDDQITSWAGEEAQTHEIHTSMTEMTNMKNSTDHETNSFDLESAELCFEEMSGDVVDQPEDPEIMGFAPSWVREETNTDPGHASISMKEMTNMKNSTPIESAEFCYQGMGTYDKEYSVQDPEIMGAEIEITE